MNVVLLRVGIDSGCGGMQGPLFKDRSFEFIPIPDERNLDERTYGNTQGRHKRSLVEYFPPRRRGKMAKQPMHVDPEFETFTYGDPTTPKRGLARLRPGDLLVFYAGLEGWAFASPPGLYLVGFFQVQWAGFASSQPLESVNEHFSANFHVRHKRLFAEQRDRLVLVKGTLDSRLYETAHPLSTTGTNLAGQPLKVVSPEMRCVFGDFGGKPAIQRSPPRWVAERYIQIAAEYVRSLS
jgi:hypothetical protein